MLIQAPNSSKLSFLYESAATTETIGRYSFVGAGVHPKWLQCVNMLADCF